MIVRFRVRSFLLLMTPRLSTTDGGRTFLTEIHTGPSHRMWESAYLTFVPFSTPALHVTARRLKALQTLLHAWLTSLTTPAKHDLCGLHENFDPRACWRNAIGAGRALLRFAKSIGANKKK